MPAQAYSVSSVLEERLKGRRAALDILRDLPDEYQLFYNPSLGGRAGIDRNDPVIDCVIAHKDKGLLAITVRTGEIVEEPGGFISQYQPQKQLYKIIDPIKPAESSARAFFQAFDPGADVFYPCGIAVVFPDAKRLEFSHPKSCYLFAEDLAAPDLAATLDPLFLEPVDSGDLAKFRANFSRLADFLKSRSDNTALFEQRRKEAKQMAEARKATPPVARSDLRMKVAAAQAPVKQVHVEEDELPPEIAEEANAARAALKARIERAGAAPRPKAEKKPKEIEAVALTPPPEEEKPMEIAKAEKAQAAIKLAAPSQKPVRTLREAPVEASRQKDMFTWLEEVQEKGEGDAMLSTPQWLGVIGVAVAIICAIYFMARNFAVATGAG